MKMASAPDGALNSKRVADGHIEEPFDNL